MALYRTTTETRYLQYARDWAGRNGYGIHNGTPTTTWPVRGVLRHTKKTRVLYDYTRELRWRDGDAQKAVSPAGKPVFWSRGNGWALAAYAKVLAPQPDLGTRWPEYRCNMQGLARSLAPAQRPDGF